jgi:hypothetical protein
MKILTADEKENLEKQLKRPRDYTERNRICVILGYDEGISVETLVASLRLHPVTVREYLQDYKSNKKTKNNPRERICIIN